VPFTLLSKLCKIAGPQPFCWAKLACFDFLHPILICRVTYWALVEFLLVNISESPTYATSSQYILSIKEPGLHSRAYYGIKSTKLRQTRLQCTISDSYMAKAFLFCQPMWEVTLASLSHILTWLEALIPLKQ
jgi:hypothetical protein